MLFFSFKKVSKEIRNQNQQYFLGFLELLQLQKGKSRIKMSLMYTTIIPAFGRQENNEVTWATQ